MSKEFDYLPWNTLLNSRIIFYIDMLESTEIYSDLKTYLASLIEPYYLKLGWIEDLNKDKFVDR